MPTARLCAICNGHSATNFRLMLPFDVKTPTGVRHSSVSAATIDLCNNCWDRHTNKRTLTMETVLQRAEQRRVKILERATGEEVLAVFEH